MTSIMSIVKLDPQAPAPLHEQAASALRRAIADGEAKPGERLPPARDLAAVLGVNANTVLRALRELRDEGLLEFRRGRGITVVGSPQQGVVVAKAKELLRLGREQGYNRGELVELLQTLP
jgi:GntR family transcriptional regulator